MGFRKSQKIKFSSNSEMDFRKYFDQFRTFFREFMKFSLRKKRSLNFFWYGSLIYEVMFKKSFLILKNGDSKIFWYMKHTQEYFAIIIFYVFSKSHGKIGEQPLNFIEIAL